MIKTLSVLLLSAGLFANVLYGQATGGVRYLGQFISPNGGPFVAGCWGWTDTTSGREYALLGNTTGTSIVEITNPNNLTERAFIPGFGSTWHEIQVHSHYAYVVNEAGGGTQIIDLSYLPDSAHLVKNFMYSNGAYTTTRAHTITISNGYMYLNGGSYKAGGIVIFSLADPVNPVYLGEYEQRYIHDCSVRNDTIYAAAISDGGIDIIDATNKSNPVLLNRITYAGAGTHNTATTVDGKYVLSTDEVGTTPKTLKIWDLQNPPSFPKVAEYQGNPTAIVHNVFVKNEFAIMSYYTAGIKIVNISDPTNPFEVGGYDSYPGTGLQYTGAWSVYPYFPSGKIIIGDMASGMHLVDFNINAPLAPSSVSAYSDYLTPTRISLSWTDPAMLASGQPLSNFKIHIYRNSVFIAEVDSGIGTFSDAGLTTHQQYTYSLYAVIPGDSSSVVTASAYAGGHAQPKPPANFGTAVASSGIVLSWINPSQQLDGTPLNDLAEILIYRDGMLSDSLSQSMPDTGQFRIYNDTITGFHSYQIQARDNETPVHLSTMSQQLFSHGGLLSSYSENFDTGLGSIYKTAGWDTVQNISYSGPASITESPDGNYPNNFETYFLTPPVVIGTNMAMSFKQIAVVRTPATGYVEISNNQFKSFTLLKAYNALSNTLWRDYIANPGDWASEFFPLDSFIGDTVSFRFRFKSTTSVTTDGWYIDDIVVGTATGINDKQNEVIPEQFFLGQNYPNPFNPLTIINYSLPVDNYVTLKIFDVLGREIATLVSSRQQAGSYDVTWDASGSPSGMYFYRLQTGRFTETKKMVLMK